MVITETLRQSVGFSGATPLPDNISENVLSFADV